MLKKLRSSGRLAQYVSGIALATVALPACSGASGAASTVKTPAAPVAPGETPASSHTTDFMIFTGDGTWGTEIGDAEAMFKDHGVTFKEVNSSQLDAMSAQDLAQFGVLYFPGGEGGTEADSVSAATHANLRQAVQQLGVSYVGFCAGAFVAVAPKPADGQDVSYGFGIVDGPVPDYYKGPGTDAEWEMTEESFPDGSKQNILWYGGPVTPNQGVVAKYPTGEPAISQIQSGAGLVIIGGIHPDVSQASLDSLGVTPDTPSQDTAWKIFNAALTRQQLPTF